MLEDLIMAATNEALRQLEEFSSDSMSKLPAAWVVLADFHSKGKEHAICFMGEFIYKTRVSATFDTRFPEKRHNDLGRQGMFSPESLCLLIHWKLRSMNPKDLSLQLCPEHFICRIAAGTFLHAALNTVCGISQSLSLFR